MGRYSRCALKVEGGRGGGRKKSCAIVLKFLPPLYYEFFFLLTQGEESVSSTLCPEINAITRGRKFFKNENFPLRINLKYISLPGVEE